MTGAERWLAALLASVVMVGCAVQPTPRSLAGQWEGRASAVGGGMPVRLLIQENGTYAGALQIDGEERALHGAISALPSGRLRFDGSSGSGTVIERQRDGRRLLRFERDDGIPLFEVTPTASADPTRK